MNSEEAQLIFQNSEEIISTETIQQSVQKMAKEIKAQIGESFPLVLPVMGGAAVFTGMLLPLLDFPLEFDYIHLTRYNNSINAKEQMHWRVAPGESVVQRTVLVLDDILDEGETLATIHQRLLEIGANHVYSAILCEKTLNKDKPIQADFCGFKVPNRYIFGCGMDIKGYWRNLPHIRAVKQ